MTLAEFIEMGGHGFYVWTSYGVGLLVFLGLYLGTKAHHKKTANSLRRRYRQQARRSLHQNSQSPQATN